jgi:EmrB/QacA subfamily drug resistance transporter
MTTVRDAHTERAAWLALWVIVAATTMVALDTTIVNVALHQIAVDLHAGSRIEWVVTAYLLAVCVSQPASGWLADRFGRRIVFLTSLAAFTAASGACALAPTLSLLVAARVVQGLGGGALIPVGMAMVLGLFPRERHGRAIGIWGLAGMLAPAIGPTLGGWLVTAVSWHWLFLINLPIGVVTFAFGLRLLPEVGERHHRPFDGLGLGLGCGGLSIAVLGLSEANEWGWGSMATIACLVGGIALLGGFVLHELRVDHPLIELRMFSERTFRLAMAVMMFVFVAQFARLVFLPLQLESLRGESALKVGLLFFPAALVSAGAMTVGGRVVDRIGPRLPIVIGTSAMAVALIGFTRLSLDTPLALIAVILAVQGLGFGLLTPPVLVAGLSDLPAHLVSQGTALRSLLNQVSGAVAVALLGAVVATSAGGNPTPTEAQSAYNNAFAVAAVGVLIALVLATRLPRRRATREIEHLDEVLVLE